MTIDIDSFSTADGRKACINIGNFSSLCGEGTLAIRELISTCLQGPADFVYLNAKAVTEVDLSGINEIIHSNYRLQQSAKKLVLVYRRHSVLEKWVGTTGLEAFIETAVLPAA